MRSIAKINAPAITAEYHPQDLSDYNEAAYLQALFEQKRATVKANQKLSRQKTQNQPTTPKNPTNQPIINAPQLQIQIRNSTNTQNSDSPPRIVDEKNTETEKKVSIKPDSATSQPSIKSAPQSGKTVITPQITTGKSTTKPATQPAVKDKPKKTVAKIVPAQNTEQTNIVIEQKEQTQIKDRTNPTPSTTIINTVNSNKNIRTNTQKPQQTIISNPKTNSNSSETNIRDANDITPQNLLRHTHLKDTPLTPTEQKTATKIINQSGINDYLNLPPLDPATARLNLAPQALLLKIFCAENRLNDGDKPNLTATQYLNTIKTELPKFVRQLTALQNLLKQPVLRGKQVSYSYDFYRLIHRLTVTGKNFWGFAKNKFDRRSNNLPDLADQLQRHIKSQTH